jgi:uncharacterized protein (DUF427 family)
VEGNHYFPPDSVKAEYLQPSTTETVCGWKGKANYYTLAVEGKKNVDAAWYYANPKQPAENIRGYVAFWKGVSIEETAGQVVRESASEGTCDI